MCLMWKRTLFASDRVHQFFAYRWIRIVWNIGTNYEWIKTNYFYHRWPYWVSVRKYRACEFFQHHYNGHYKPATGICYIREHRNDEKQINKLTVLEGLFYAFLICVMGLPLSLIVANTILPTFFNQPDLWLFTIQPTIFPLILEGIVICVVAIIVPHVSFRYFRKTSIVARLRVVE